MSKYIIPSVAVSTLYSAWRGFYGSEDIRIKSVDDAVKCLNENNNTQEALRFISTYHYGSHPHFVSNLSSRSLGMLARMGSDLVNYAQLETTHVENSISYIEKLLNQFDLGPDWRDAVAWLGRTPYAEEDLSCEDDTFVLKPSQVDRLYHILQTLFLATESRFDSSSIGIQVVDFLYSMYSLFDEDRPDISLLALKTLSNVALKGPAYASRIFESDWLPILAYSVGHGKTLGVRLVSHKICQNGLYTLGMVPYSLPSSVYELHLSEEEPLVDVVMIHGLRGSVIYTWRQKDGSSHVITECWPKDWIPQDIQEPVRILGIDYPSYLIQFSGTMESIQVRADRFKRQLTDAGLGKRPIVFICHSMGGLLAKRLLLDSPEWTHMTVGILFLATPHRGSPYADWGYSILHPSEDVRLLHAKSELNKKLNEDFSQIADKIPVIASMIETKESNIIGTAKGIVVPVESAVLGKGAVYHIEEVHHNICKPSERTSPSYGVILNFLRDSILEAKKVKPL